MPLFPPGFADRLSDWVQLIRYELQEQPDLRVTVAQGSRMWGIDECRLEGIFDAFVHAGLLRRSLDGVYGLRDGVGVAVRD